MNTTETQLINITINTTIYVVLIKINTKIPLQQFLPLLEAEIQRLLHPAQANFFIFSCTVSDSTASLTTV
jgi:hypothetical protein